MPSGLKDPLRLAGLFGLLGTPVPRLYSFDAELPPMTEEMCLQRAEECEDRARATSDKQLKAEWSQLSIEWHYLANWVHRLREHNGHDDIVAT